MSMIQRLCQSVAVGQLGRYGLLTLLQKGAGFILLPITTHYLTLAEYGVLESLTILLVFCSLLEMSAGALPKLAADHSKQEQGSLLASALGLSFSLGALLALVVALLLSWAPIHLFANLTTLQITSVSLTVWLMILLQPLLMWFRVQQKANLFCWVVGGQTLIQFAGSWSVLLLGYGLEGVLWVSFLAHAVALGLALVLTAQAWRHWPQRLIMQQTLSYQWCLILASLALFVTHGLDRLLLGQWLGAETLARYGILIKLAEVVAIVFGVVESWWIARRFQTYKQSDGAEQVAFTHLRLLCFLLILLTGALLLAPVVLTAILPEAYHAGLVWLPALLLAMGLKLATSIFDMGCYWADKPVWLSRVNFAMAGLALVLYVVLIPRYQVWGLLLAINLVYGVRLLAFAWLSQRLMPLPYESKPMLQIVSLFALVVAINFLPVASHWKLPLSFVLLCGLMAQGVRFLGLFRKPEYQSAN